MKIKFTAITKEEAIDRLEKMSEESRLYAIRLGAKPCFAKEASTATTRAKRYSDIADMLRTSGDEVSMSDADEALLYLALAHFEHTFDASYRMYTIMPESVSELPFEIMLANGAYEAQKTE